MDCVMQQSHCSSHVDVFVLKGHPCTAQLVRYILESESRLMVTVGEFREIGNPADVVTATG
jgi:hypothetical protein